MRHLRFASILGILVVISSPACNGDDDNDTFGGLGRSEVLGELDSEQSMALCDATKASYESMVAGAENKRAHCMLQIAGDLQIAKLNIDLGATATSDDLVDLCEMALERCLEEGPMHTPCTSIDFDSSCEATVGDFEQCNAASASVLPLFAATDCETIVKDEDEEARIQDEARDALSLCAQELLMCDATTSPEETDEEPWFDVTLSEFRE